MTRLLLGLGWRELDAVISLRLDTFTSMTIRSAEGTVSEVSFTSAAFSPKMAAQEALFRASSVSDFRSDLADEDVARLHFRTDTDDAIRAEVRSASSRRSEYRA